MTLVWAAGVAWTLALELSIITLVLGRPLRRWWLPLVLVLAGNLVTVPISGLVLPRFEPHWQYVLAGAILAIVIEGLLLCAVTRRIALPLLASLLANTLSFAFVETVLPRLV